MTTTQQKNKQAKRDFSENQPQQTQKNKKQTRTLETCSCWMEPETDTSIWLIRTCIRMVFNLHCGPSTILLNRWTEHLSSVHRCPACVHFLLLGEMGDDVFSFFFFPVIIPFVFVFGLDCACVALLLCVELLSCRGLVLDFRLAPVL
jgi:hypothetical protein